MTFYQHIINWYTDNKRDLPWRNTRNPYKIWLSEIMLQQTRVEQGLPYYNKFVNKFPTVHHLSAASEDLVMKMWQGLGYYSRARNLHATAKYISHELDGRFPDNYKDLKKLKGVGEYTAAAIASFSYDEPAPVVDGNVYRLLSRYFGVDLPINATEGIKYFKALAEEVMHTSDPATYNQAVMEFGARQCKPQNPDCEQCPLNSSCVALQEKKVASLPVKLKKGKIKKRYFNYLVPFNSTEIILEKRTGKDIWRDLYQFPLIETQGPANLDQIIAQERFRSIPGADPSKIWLYNQDDIVHKLSHQHIFTRFWIVNLEDELPGAVKKSRVKDYAMPVLLANFVHEFEFSN
ncbi:A/G-specific adenine glycosylase [Robertkochia marina]|uniref:Adenine DNA glycosylase n=1 Tax=Robertkochia marina TaxID=1227945 RepID=A0A4S3M322_9FLAO|nr:A/G-specific adenine glycosylase [Robertkochia marina]THD69552.1 A/G-specific adenine glycosylase [Robertkochia marina]TRZ47191.1 A/G-specific adenine glycosylase [Robertkochia marina]